MSFCTLMEPSPWCEDLPQAHSALTAEPTCLGQDPFHDVTPQALRNMLCWGHSCRLRREEKPEKRKLPLSFYLSTGAGAEARRLIFFPVEGALDC